MHYRISYTIFPIDEADFTLDRRLQPCFQQVMDRIRSVMLRCEFGGSWQRYAIVIDAEIQTSAALISERGNMPCYFSLAVLVALRDVHPRFEFDVKFFASMSRVFVHLFQIGFYGHSRPAFLRYSCVRYCLAHRCPDNRCLQEQYVCLPRK